MELEFTKTPIRYLATALQDVKSTEVTQEVRLPDGMPDIGRILSTTAQVLLRSKEWDADRITVTGNVITSTLYAPEDGTEPRSMENWIPFQIRYDGACATHEGPMEMLPLLRSADSRCLSARKMMVRASISALMRGFEERETQIFSPEQVPEDVQLLEHTYPMEIPTEAGEKTAVLDEELTIPGAEKILCCTMHPMVTEQRIVNDQAVFKGIAQFHALYRDESSQLHSWDGEVAFSQLAQLDNKHDDKSSVRVQLAVTSFEWDLAEGGKLRVKASIVGQYLIHDLHAVRVVQEAYSPQRPVEVRQEVLRLPVRLDFRQGKFSPEVLLPGMMGQGLFGWFYPDFPRQKQTSKGMELELNGVFQELIHGEDALQGSNTRWEGKYLIPTDEHSIVTTIPSTIGAVRAVPGGDGLTLMGQTELSMFFDTLQEIPVVTGLELGELQELPDSRPSLVICSCREGSLWELAKRYGSTVSAIKSANGIQDMPEDQRMLLIPVV